MRNRAFRNALITFAIVDIVPAFVLALTFYPPFEHRRTAHGALRSFAEVRVACALALLALVAAVMLRNPLERLLERVDARVRRMAEDASPDETLDPTPASLAMLLTIVAGTIGVCSVGLAFTSETAFATWIQEDSVIELGSALSWFGAALFALAALVVKGRDRLWRSLLFYLPLIALFIFCGGEEASWGQRLFHFHTPAALAANKQHEANLHDLGSISVEENAFFVFTTVCCLVVPWLLERAAAWRILLRRLGAPLLDPFVAKVYSLGLAAWILVGVRFGTLGFSPLSLWGYYTQFDDEIWEFYAAFGFLALASLDFTHRLLEARRATRSAAAAAPGLVPRGA